MLNQLAAFMLPGPDGPQPFGDKPLGAVTEDDIELFFTDLLRQGRAASTRNKYLQLVKAMFRWATRKKYLARNPVADCETLKHQKETSRRRRLAPDVVNAKGQVEREGEERRLLAVAGSHLERLIIAAVETGCRRGELLKLQWKNVDAPQREVAILAEHAKDREQRILPISSRLAAVLEMATTDPAGREYSPDAYVFGELGRKVKSIKKAWETAVLKAHGYEPEWKGRKLSPASRAQLRAIDLHFHDLRHEAGSRFIEAGWPIHHVQEMLGHASLEQTSTYLNVTRVGLHESMRRFEQARVEQTGIRCTTVAQTPTIEHPPLCNDGPDKGTHALVN